MRYAPDALRLEITDDGRSVLGPAGGGHGLIGMRERVVLYGGELKAGRGRSGFTVRAWLPLAPGEGVVPRGSAPR